MVYMCLQNENGFHVVVSWYHILLQDFFVFVHIVTALKHEMEKES